MHYRKICVEVVARFLREGGVRPVEIVWEDGRRFLVERIVQVRHAPAHVRGVLPVRYTCLIGGAQKNIYFEPSRLQWFVEVGGE